jgi:putative spermidine/putrescine transport system permease protein
MVRRLMLALLLALFILPLGYLLVLSVAADWRFPQLMPAQWTLTHWFNTGSSGSNWLKSVWNSAALATLTASVSTILGFFTAKHLSQHAARRWWLWLAYLPYAFSPVIYAHTLKFYFNVSGWSGTFAGVALAHVFLAFPFSVLLFMNHFDGRMQAMEQLTYTLGGTPRQAFWRVLVPVSRLALLTCFFQTFLISWFEYGLCSVIGQGQVRTLTVAVYQYIGEANQYVAALASCWVCLPPLVLLWANQRFIFQDKNVKTAI